jgi:hypothetical protein
VLNPAYEESAECISRASHFTTAVPVFGGKEVIHVEKMPPVAPNSI